MRRFGIALAAAGLLILMTPLTALANPLPRTHAFLYAADSSGAGRISGYSIDPTNGRLTALAGFPVVSPGNDTNDVTVDPTGQFLYLTNENSNNVAGFTIDQTSGALTPIDGSPFDTGAPAPNDPNVDPSGRFLYTANEGNGTISAFSIDPTTGALTPIPGSPFAAPQNPDSLSITPTGRFMYTSFGDIGSVGGVSMFSLDPVSGAPTLLGTISFGADIDWVRVDPSGQHLYAADFIDGAVFGLNINQVNGNLTAVPGFAFATSGSPDKLTIDPTNQLLLTANDGSFGPSDVDMFQINSNGSLNPITSLPAGNSPSGVAFDASASFAYAANENSNNLTVYGPGGGQTVTAGSEPVSIATTPWYLTGSFTSTTNSAVSLIGVRASGSINISHASSVQLCGTSSVGSLTVTSSSGPVNVGGGCARNLIGGGGTFTSNHGGVTLTNNSFGGSLICSSNFPAPTGSGNTAASKTGQCSGL